MPSSIGISSRYAGGLRVDVGCVQTVLMVSMAWVINADTLKLIALSVDCSEVQARFNGA